MKRIDWDISIRMGNLVNAQQGMCVDNVARTIRLAGHELPQKARYVEGIWYLGGQIFQHAWIETDDSIIDPTLAAIVPKALLCERMEYHVIINRSLEDFLAYVGDQAPQATGRLKLLLPSDDSRIDEMIDKVDPLPGHSPRSRSS
jgi:hypothetical protein